MFFMNENDIAEAVWRLRRQDNRVALKYALYLSAWVDIVNSNSDGWAHWRGGAAAAGRLQRLVQEAVRGARRAEADFSRALGPIKACATRRGLPAPTLQEPM